MSHKNGLGPIEDLDPDEPTSLSKFFGVEEPLDLPDPPEVEIELIDGYLEGVLDENSDVLDRVAHNLASYKSWRAALFTRLRTKRAQ